MINDASPYLIYISGKAYVINCTCMGHKTSHCTNPKNCQTTSHGSNYL